MSQIEDGCRLCRAVKNKYRNQSTDGNFFIVHATRDIVKGSSSSEKTKILDQVSTRVSALRNHAGGALIVHLEGQQEKDKSLDYFDQCFSERLTNLIEDGEQYTSVYKRQWLNRLPDFREHFDFVLLKVKRSTTVSTVDTNTKLRNDHENLTPSPLHILNLLAKSCSVRHCPEHLPPNEGHVDRVSLLFPKAPTIRGLKDDPQEFQEDRHIEHKSIWPRKPETLEKIENSETDFVNYLWYDLKLRDNVTSMSKIQEGGSVFFGVVEIKDASTDSPRPVIHGFIKVPNKPENTAEIRKLRNFPELKKKKKEQGKRGEKNPRTIPPPILQIKIDEEKLKKSFVEKINTELTILADRQFSSVGDPWRLIQIAFHDVPGYSPQSQERRVVLEVAIAYTTGVIFYDKFGPKTFEIQDNTKISRMDKKQWLRKFSKLYDLIGSPTP